VKPQDRIIVALDVPTVEEALGLVHELDGLISFYKVGLELLMSGGMDRLLQSLVEGRRVFVDLKLPNDIPETVRRAVTLAADKGVEFLTLSGSATVETIEAAASGRGGRAKPRLLFVPFLSSLDRSDFSRQTQSSDSEFEDLLRERTERARGAGADGFIVSGPEIKLLRDRYRDTLLVSPGIRPEGSSKDDHKRSCTPAEAIRLGADYIVVGRPIRNASNRRDAAERIIGEVALAMTQAAAQ
jgi:orotidine-5'-phosphate decarboxylase